MLVDMPGGGTRVGIDVVDLERFTRVAARRPEILARLFTPAERERCDRARDPVPHLAARFAAKEAVRKALGRAFAWHACEVRVLPSGAPTLALEAGTVTADGLEVQTASLSLSHEAGAAVAVVVLSVG